MRDLLPDLLHERLPVDLRAEVEAHVQSCHDCTVELKILRRVVAVTRVPHIETSRIVAAIPPYRKAGMWNRMASSGPWRVAAAVVLLVGGAGAILIARDRSADSGPSSRVTAAPPAPARLDSGGAGSTPVVAGTTSAVAVSRPRQQPGSALAVGEPYHDLSDDELRELLDEVGKLDGITSAETEIVVPAIGRGRT